MGGIGSGRYTRHQTKTTTDQAKRIDVRYMHQQGLLKPGMTGQLQWSVNGHPSGDIRYQTHEDHLSIHYQYRTAGGWEPIDERIAFSRSHCHFGGQRLWFLCPDCSRRVAVLYGTGKLFRCRHCHQLPYESQQIDSISRLIEQKHKLGRRMFEHYEYGSGWGRKKGMHQTTYERLLERYFHMEDDYHHQLQERFPELTGYL